MIHVFPSGYFIMSIVANFPVAAAKAFYFNSRPERERQKEVSLMNVKKIKEKCRCIWDRILESLDYFFNSIVEFIYDCLPKNKNEEAQYTFIICVSMATAFITALLFR